MMNARFKLKKQSLRCAAKKAMNAVKRERLEKGWTQKELADKLGVKQSSVAKWERHGAVYRRSTWEKLAAVFGINEDSFR